MNRRLSERLASDHKEPLIVEKSQESLQGLFCRLRPKELNELILVPISCLRRSGVVYIPNPEIRPKQDIRYLNLSSERVLPQMRLLKEVGCWAANHFRKIILTHNVV